MRQIFDAFLSLDFFQSRHDDNPDIRHDVVLDDLQGIDAAATEFGGCNSQGP